MLVCNSNSYCNTDYGIPIIATKSTDYRTTTGTNHRYIPLPDVQFAECRVKADIKPNQKRIDVTVRDDTFQSTYRNGYTVKQAMAGPHQPRSPLLKNVNYTRGVQDAIQKISPPLRPFKLSEMKESYTRKQRAEDFIIYPPELYAKCEIKALGRDEQPPVHPEEKGYYRYMDPYVSTARADFVPFSKNQQDGIGRKDIVTYYDASGIPRGGKGYGPKNGPAVEPLLSIRKFPIFDKSVLKHKFNDKRIPNSLKRVPHSGMKSEYQGKYTSKTRSDFYPYIFESGEAFRDPFANAGAWQNLAAPAMYCTDYCHIGKCWPISAVIEARKPSEVERARTEECFSKSENVDKYML